MRQKPSAEPAANASQDAQAWEDNPCAQMMRAFASLDGSGVSGECRRLELSRAKLARCAKSPEEIPEPARSALISALREHPPRGKLCHDNAWRICAMSDGPFTLVSGYALSMIPMEHSWIAIDLGDGREAHFDPTDHALFKGKAFSEHVETARLTPEEARARAAATGHSGPWTREILLEAVGAIAPFGSEERPAGARTKMRRAR